MNELRIKSIAKRLESLIAAGMIMATPVEAAIPSIFSNLNNNTKTEAIVLTDEELTWNYEKDSLHTEAGITKLRNMVMDTSGRVETVPMALLSEALKIYEDKELKPYYQKLRDYGWIVGIVII